MNTHLFDRRCNSAPPSVPSVCAVGAIPPRGRCRRIGSRGAVAIALIVLGSAPAGAQARFQTGDFAWTPVITLRDAGLDTNVFDEAADPKRDTVAVMSPQADGVYDNGTWKLALAGGADFVYFRRYTDERSINTRGSARVDVGLARVTPFASIGWVDTRERQNAEIDLRARRTERDVRAGARLQLSSRIALEGSARGGDFRYRTGQIFRGVDIADRLNRESTGAAARLVVDVTPLTRFAVDSELSRDRFEFVPEQDTDHLRVTGGFEFAPDAIIRGRASVGYHRMDARGAIAVPYEGVTAAVDIGYVLLGRTRFDVRVNRDTTYSLAEQPYYLSTSYGGEVLHNVAGPLDVSARYTRELLDYPGLDGRFLAQQTRVNRYGGAVLVRATERFRLGVHYEFNERLSDDTPSLEFDRRRMYTTITYGF